MTIFGRDTNHSIRKYIMLCVHSIAHHHHNSKSVPKIWIYYYRKNVDIRNDRENKFKMLHLIRRDNQRKTKQVFEARPERKRRWGRPRKEWEQER